MVLKLLLGVLIVVAAVLVMAATKPATFHIEKSVMIQARPEKVFALIEDLPLRQRLQRSMPLSIGRGRSRFGIFMSSG